MRVNPVGARINGKGNERPKSEHDVSMVPTSRSTRGRNSNDANPATLRARVSSSSAPPST